MGPTVRLFAPLYLLFSFFLCFVFHGFGTHLLLFFFFFFSSFLFSSFLFFSRWFFGLVSGLGFFFFLLFFPFHWVSIPFFFLLEFIEVVTAVDVEVVTAVEVAIAAVVTMGCSDSCNSGFFFFFFFGFLEKKNTG